jgi:hypothetical protein
MRCLTGGRALVTDETLFVVNMFASGNYGRCHIVTKEVLADE